MNEMTIKAQETVEQGWVSRWLTAVTQKLFIWLCQCELDVSPLEAQRFMVHSGFGWEDTQLYRSMVHRKFEDMI